MRGNWVGGKQEQHRKTMKRFPGVPHVSSEFVCPQSRHQTQDTQKRSCQKSLFRSSLRHDLKANGKHEVIPTAKLENARICSRHMHQIAPETNSETLFTPASRIAVGEIEVMAGLGRVRTPWIATTVDRDSLLEPTTMFSLQP